MPRRERPVDPSSGPMAAFVLALRQVRIRAGSPTYQKMAATSHYSQTTLADAAGGQRLPRWPTVEDYARICDAENELPRLRRLWERAQAGVSDSAVSVLLKPQEGPLPEIWNLPARNPDFVGRQVAIAQIYQQTHTHAVGDGPGVVALWGIGGIGKTQLALEYAYRHARNLGVVWWIDGSDEITAREGLLDLAQHLQFGAEKPRNTLVRLQAALRARSDWLLIFDNLQDPPTYNSLAPTGPGHVLLTGRSREVRRLGADLELDEFAREESVQLLRRRVASLSEDGAQRVAEVLADYPLALEQAGCFLDDTGMDVSAYLDLVTRRPREAGMEQRTLQSHPGLVEVFDTSRSRLQESDPISGAFADQLAFFSAEPVPVDFDGLEDEPEIHPSQDPDQADERPVDSRTGHRGWGVRLSPASATPLAGHRLAALGLVRRQGSHLRMHALVQTLLRDRLSSSAREVAWLKAAELLSTAQPGPPDDPASWDRFGQLTPHIRAILGAAPDRPPEAGFRAFAGTFTRYLYLSGRYDLGLPISQDLHERWNRAPELGPDHPDTLLIGNRLVGMQFGAGRYEEAAALGAAILDRRRRVSGPDHEETLSVANNLAAALSELSRYTVAVDICRQTLQARQRTVGPDHPLTLTAASNLAAILDSLQEYGQARKLCEDVWNRRRRLLGSEHPDTLWTAHVLADTLVGEGNSTEAARRYEQVLTSRQRVLGPDHPDTLSVGHDLAVLLIDSNRRRARTLLEDVLPRRRRVLGPDHPETRKSEQALRRLDGVG